MSGTNDEEYLQELGANERIWRSATASASEKAAAWRRQLLLLEHLTREDTPANAYQLLQMHYAKLDTPEYQEYLQQRVQSVEKLLACFQQNDAKLTAAVMADDLQLDESWFEAPCHGAYESCSANEITADDLQWLRKDPVVDGPSTSGCNGQSHSPETGRSTIANYFQPLKQQPPPQVLSSAARNNSSKLENNNVSDLAQLDNTAAKHISPFRTAREVLALQNLKKQNACTFSANPAGPSTATSAVPNSNAYFNYGITKKMLGGRRTIRSGFVLPVSAEGSSSPLRCNTIELQPSPPINSSPEVVDERLLNIDPKMIELIKNEIMHTYKAVGWDDVAGLDYAKSVIKEAVVYPLLRPDIFSGLRRPPRGILLFGPPGTGKTLIGKCIASQSQSTFFSISASSLTSKWVGDSEKMVRALFAVAAVHQPAVVFIDEVDSLLAKRSETEHDSSRKLKNEFLVQLDGAATSDEDRIVIVGATNRPQELDDAARRRFARRLYIPLPESEARIQILTQLLQTVSNNLSAQDIQEIGRLTEGYSGADMDILCREASMEPLRSIPPEQIPHIVKDKVRAVHKQDFQAALHSVRPSVSQDDLKQYITWNSVYGAVRQPS